MEPRFKCTKCHAKLKADRELGGSTIDCPRCGESVTVPQVSFETDDIIGGFRLENWIGSGSMGEVYEARQLSMDRPVALKILRSDLSDDAEHIDRFSNEVRMLAKLDHPNIVTAFEAGRYGEHYFLAMSYVNGYNLEECMGERDKLPEKETLKVILKVTKALAYAWERFQILHRDIKPSNIMIDTAGEVKLTDMGISMRVGDEMRPDEGGFAIGTPYYMSPEQASGSDDLDFRADMFSLGSTLYHLVTGEPPFDSETSNEILLKVIHDPYVDPKEVNPELSDTCCAIINRMMQKQRNDRYPDWDELIDDLQRAIRGEDPGTFKPPDTPTVAVKKKKKKRMHVRGATSLSSPTLAATLAPPPPKSTKWLIPLIAATIGFILIGIVLWQIFASKEVAPAPLPLPPALSSTESPVDVPEPMPESQPEPEPDPAQPGANSDAERLAALETQFQQAQAYVRNHPTAYEEAVSRFETLKNDGVRTKYALMAEDEIARILKTRQQAVDATRNRIVEEALAQERKGDAKAAIWALRNYKGEFAEDLRPQLKRLASKMNERLKAAKSERERSQQEATAAYQAVVEQVAESLVKLQYPAAVETLEAASKDPALSLYKKQIDTHTSMIQSISSWQDAVMQTFRDEVGTTVSVGLKRGPKTVEIKEVVPPRIKATERVGTGHIGVNILIKDLTFSELTQRVGRAENAGTPILLGLFNLKKGNADAALQQFASVPQPLGSMLIQKLHETYPEPVEKAALVALNRLLEPLSVSLKDGAPLEPVIIKLQMMDVTEAQQEQMNEQVESYRGLYGYTAMAGRFDKVLRVLTGESVSLWPLDTNQVAFAWLKLNEETTNRVYDPVAKAWKECVIKAHRRVYFRPTTGSMVCNFEGMFVAEGSGSLIKSACRSANAISIEAVIAPQQFQRGGRDAYIMSSSDPQGLVNFALVQSRGDLLVRLRTSDTDAVNVPGFILADMRRYGSLLHIVMSYRSGMLTCYINGVNSLESTLVTGDLRDWEAYDLVFGNSPNGRLGWTGEMARVAVYGRFVEEDEAKRLFALFQRSMTGQ